MGADNHNEIDKYLRKLASVKKYEKILRVGDFNLKKVNWSNLQSLDRVHNLFIDTFIDMGFEQVINVPTHTKGNVLDLVLCNKPELLSNIAVSKENLICHTTQEDHFVINFDINLKSTRKKYLNVKFIISKRRTGSS